MVGAWRARLRVKLGTVTGLMGGVAGLALAQARPHRWTVGPRAARVEYRGERRGKRVSWKGSGDRIPLTRTHDPRHFTDTTVKPESVAAQKWIGEFLYLKSWLSFEKT